MKLIPFRGELKFIAGADLAYSKKDSLFFASVVLLEMPDLKVVRELFIARERHFPYIPGYLSFREAPLLLELFEQLDIIPSLVVIDGQGIAHPRGLGLASHIGLFLETPTIGCAKSRLCGDYEMPGWKKGENTPLFYKGKVIGYVLRTRNGVKPVFLSPGHLVAVEDVVPLALKLTGRWRIPLPTRYAHIAVGKYKEGYLSHA